MFRSVKPRKARLPVHSTVAKTEVEEKKVESSMALQDIVVSLKSVILVI